MTAELLRGLLPAMPAPSGREMMRAAAGGAAGLALAGAVTLLAGLNPVLLAPMGATAVLAFAVPNSPLAQPWSALVGCLVSALVAVPAAMFLPAPWSAAVAAGLAIAVMIAVRALHPPGGAAALLTALAADPAQPFALIAPLMMGTTILIAGAVIWNRLTGRVYPLRQTAAAGIATPQISLSRAELDALLVRFRQGANLGAADLGRLLAAAEAEAAHHRFDGTTCGDIMTQPLISVPPDAHMTEIADLFARHAIKSVPVLAAGGGLAGIIQQGDLVRALMSTPTLRRRLTAARIMRTGAPQVQADLPVGALLEWLAVQGPQVVAVMDGGRVVGVITRSDVINLLLREARARAEL